MARSHTVARGPDAGRPGRARPARAWHREVQVAEEESDARYAAIGSSRGRRTVSRRSPVKVVVDYDECASNAVCMGILPEVFEVRDDGYLYVLNEHPPESMREKLRECVNGCPTGAISLVEDE